MACCIAPERYSPGSEGIRPRGGVEVGWRLGRRGGESLLLSNPITMKAVGRLTSPNIKLFRISKFQSVEDT